MPPTTVSNVPATTHLSWLRSALLFAHRHHRKAIVFVAALVLYVCGLSVSVQLLYPADRTLPGTRLAGIFMPFETGAAVHAALDRLDNHLISISLAGQTYQVTPEEAGVTFATHVNTQAVLEYPYRQRLMPFSIFWQHQAFVQADLRPRIDRARLVAFATRLANESHVQTVEGSVSVVNGKVVETSPKSGSSTTIHEIVTSFMGLTGDVPSTMKISGQTVPPQYTRAALHAAAIRATNLLKPFVIAINGSNYTVPAAMVGTWLTFTPDDATKTIEVGINQDMVAGYLDTIAQKHYVAPKLTTVSLLDGQEVSRQAGRPGVYVSAKNGAAIIADALGSANFSATLYLAPLGSPVHYTRHYTDSQAGLQALLDYLVASKGAYGITVHEISTRGWSASASGTRSFVTASTYKLFVAVSTLKRIESGAFHWTDSTANTTLSTCMNRMIVISDNACAEALASRIGYTTVINEMRGLGLHATSHSDTFYSTSNDESILLTKLATGKILNSSDRNFLLGLMKQQIYRSGIPAGTGVPVADKVGFLWTLLNDAAVVYSPHSTYVLVIMTDHSSWSQIADAAHQIQAQMSR